MWSCAPTPRSLGRPLVLVEVPLQHLQRDPSGRPRVAAWPTGGPGTRPPLVCVPPSTPFAPMAPSSPFDPGPFAPDPRPEVGLPCSSISMRRCRSAAGAPRARPATLLLRARHVRARQENLQHRLERGTAVRGVHRERARAHASQVQQRGGVLQRPVRQRPSCTLSTQIMLPWSKARPTGPWLGSSAICADSSR